MKAKTGNAGNFFISVYSYIYHFCLQPFSPKDSVSLLFASPSASSCASFLVFQMWKWASIQYSPLPSTWCMLFHHHHWKWVPYSRLWFSKFIEFFPFQGAPTHADFQTSYFNLKIRGLGTKRCDLCVSTQNCVSPHFGPAIQDLSSDLSSF